MNMNLICYFCALLIKNLFTMKKIYLFVLILLTCTVSFAQVDVNRSQERIIKFQMQDINQIEWLTLIMSIDKIQGNEVIAYTNEEEFEHFLTLNIPYEIVEKPVLTLEDLNVFDFEDFKSGRNDWNSYPNYQQYLDLMNYYATEYPDLCRKVEFGTSVQNRNLWACVLSKNVHVREAEPQVFFTSSMHGDELTGYVLTLRYMDYLLSNYGTNERVTYLLDNMEIWINPLANPDGTFYTGNGDVSGARRANANNVDLNRNYVTNPTARQKETQAFIALQAAETFVLSVNIHGGSEIFNYTWDKNCTLPADNLWWKMVGYEYVDTVHLYNPSYMLGDICNYCTPGGMSAVTHGANWYPASDTRQDYANYYDYTREFCLEISNTKTPNASSLPNYWNYNYRSFLNYTQQALYGIHGVVTDACSGEPVYAKIFVNSHDMDNSFVMTDPRVGYYARMIKAGTYSVTFSADGYVSQTVSITVSDYQKTVKNIKLFPTGATNIPVADFKADVTEILVNETVQFTDLSENATSWEWYFEGGIPETTNEQNPTVLYKNPGKFDVKLTASNSSCSHELLMEDYIAVKHADPIADFEADTTLIFENDTVHFTDLSENATSWEWFFEGGTPETSNEQNPTVLYENPGSFNVRLKAINDAGSHELLKENYITVWQINVQPVAGFEADKTEIFVNEVVHFTDFSEYATDWEWYFEGGTPETTTEQNPTILYTTAGVFNVKLTASNANGSDEMLKEQYILVKELAVNEIESIHVKIYPNPVSNETTLNIDADIPIYKMELFNLLGAIVKTTYPNGAPYTLTVSDIEKGIYFLRVKTPKGSQTLKVVKF